MAGAALALQNIRKRFGEAVAIDNVSVSLVAGEHLALIGPSGCGKSTMLLVIAGLMAPDSGTVTIGGTVMTGPKKWVEPDRRRVGMVFQDYALFPHLNVTRNIAFGLDKLSKAAQAARVAEVLELVGLEALAERYPHELSSGQQQRVALARSLAPDPDVVLLDEPFSNLDRTLRDNLRVETKAVLRRAGATAVLVTHDHSEALGFADRLAVMRNGQLLQMGTPEEVYEMPEDRFVAGFLGAADFIPATRRPDGMVVSDLGVLGPAPEGDPAAELVVMVRPDDVTFDVDDAGPATVSRREYQGSATMYELTLASGERINVRRPPSTTCPPGTRVRPRLVDGREAALFSGGRRVGSRPAGDPSVRGAVRSVTYEEGM